MQTPYILSFGRYLKAIRESRRIAISSVADHLRVSIWHLMLIETEDHEKLPDEVYVKGTLKAYAEVIGVDPADIVQRYEINRKAWLESAKSEQDLMRSGKHSVYRMTVALGVLLIVVIISITVFKGLNAPVTEYMDEPGLAASQAPQAFVFFEHEPAPPGDNEEYAYTLNDRLRLKLVALAETRIHLAIDGHSPEQYTLNPRDEMQVEASEALHLTLSDTHGVKVFINNHAVNLKGAPGEAVNVLIRKKEAEKP